VLTLVQQTPAIPDLTFAGGDLPVVGLASAAYVPEVTLPLADLDLPALRVDRVASRERQRELLDAAVEPPLRERYRRDGGRAEDDAAFRRWKRQSSLAGQVAARVEQLLNETHPPGRRPYTNTGEDQIRRDVALWARVRIDKENPAGIATENELRAEEDRRFRVRKRGRRSRLPTTPRGVRFAVERAHKLLLERAQ